MKLNYRILGSGKPLVILHGVFGSADNWQTVGKKLADHFKVFLVDLRNHGLSPHSDAFSYGLMVDDIIELLEDESIDSAYFVGHSMGGKVVMNLATLHPELVDKLIVVDIAPKYYSPHHQNILAAFKSLNLNTLGSRKEAEEILSKQIPEFGVRQFILKNLGRNDQNGFEWKINYPAIEKNIEELGSGLGADQIFNGKVLFINGVESNYIQESDFKLIHSHFPNADIKSVKGAGHWVHAEQPEATYKIILDFLS